jgi:hypothetical protein
MRRSVLLLLASGLLCGCPKSSTPAAPAAPSAPAAAQSSAPKADQPKPADAPKPADQPKPADKPADAGAKTAVESFWKDVGLGTVAQYSMVTDMQKPMKMKTEMTQTKTLSTKDDKGYALKVVTTANGAAMPAQEEKGEWMAPAGTASGSPANAPKDLGNEKLKVGAGEFDCKHWQTVADMAGVKTTTDTWMYKNLLVKMMMKNDNMTSTSELTKLDKK